MTASSNNTGKLSTGNIMEQKNTANRQGHLVAIVAMCFLFAMISFVTNLAAPIGTIWKGEYNWAGMVGNFMNFFAYLIMAFRQATS